MASLQNVLCLIFAVSVASSSFSPGLAITAAGVLRESSGDLYANNTTNRVSLWRRNPADNPGKNEPKIVPNCSCDSGNVTFDTVFWTPRKWMTLILVTNYCEHGMKDILVDCKGWKQKFVPDKSVLTVDEESGICVFLPQGVLRGGRGQYDIVAHGSPSSTPLKLETTKLDIKYRCFDCSCRDCCVPQ